MTQPRRAWLIAACLWVCLALLFGSALPPIGLFYRPLTLEFHTTRAGVSMLSSVQALGNCLGALTAGWLLGFLDGKRVIIIGALVEAASYLLSSQAHTFNFLLLFSGLVGLGVGISTLIPVSFIIGNWFGEQAGLAMGLTMTGTSLGGSAMVGLITYCIAQVGWRRTYMILALPILLIVLPLAAAMRSRPPTGAESSTPASRLVADLPGLDVRQALRTREFWLIGLSQFLFGSVAAGILNHLVPYLQGIGYARTRAALAMSVTLALASLGKIVLGFATDRIGARWAVALDFFLEAIGALCLIGALHIVMLGLGVVCYGLSWGAPLALLPLLTIESLGLKCYGAISGLTGVAFTAGNAFGPLAAGWVFDVTGRYTDALAGMAVSVLICALAVLGCRPLSATSVAVADREARVTLTRAS